MERSCRGVSGIVLRALATRGRKRVPASEAQRGGWSEAKGQQDNTAYAISSFRSVRRVGRKGKMQKWNLRKLLEIPLLYPRGESNAYRRNRNPKFYPLNYRGISGPRN